MCQKGEIAVTKSQKVIFRKSQKLFTERAPQRQPIQNMISIAIHSISKFNWFCLRRTPMPMAAREASSFCDFFKANLLRFHRIFLLFDSSKPLFFSDVLTA